MTDLQLSRPPSLDAADSRSDDRIAERLQTKARVLRERSLELRRSSYSELDPIGVAMRRRAAELDLNAVALRLAADGVSGASSD